MFHYEIAVKAEHVNQTNHSLNPHTISSTFKDNTLYLISNLSPSKLYHLLPQTKAILINASTVSSTQSSARIDSSNDFSTQPNAANAPSTLPNAVAIFEHYPGVKDGWSEFVNMGLARLLSVDHRSILLDVNVDNLIPLKQYSITINESGDLSNVPVSLGMPLRTLYTGCTDDQGRLRVVDDVALDISDVIGRSLVVGDNIAGVIARSAGAFGNSKTICSCSGKTIWESKM